MTVVRSRCPRIHRCRAFRVYVETNGTAGEARTVLRSGIAVTNTSDAPTTVRLELTDLDGTPTGSTRSLTLPASGHVPRFIDEFFPALTTPFSGLLRITSTAPNIAVVGLRLAFNQRGDIVTTTTPPVDENAPPPASGLFFPHFAAGGGWAIQSFSSAATRGRPRPDDPVQGAGRTAPGVVRGPDGASTESVKTPIRGKEPTHRQRAPEATAPGSALTVGD